MYTYIVGKYNIHLHSVQKRSANITQSSLFCLFLKFVQLFIRFRFLASNATFNNISIISWRSALLVENSGVPGENYRPTVSQWQTLSYHVLWSIPRLSGIIVQINFIFTNNALWYTYIVRIYTVRQKLSNTWLVSIISFLIMNLFHIGLLFSLPVHTYLLTCETGYWSISIDVYMTGCVKSHVYFSTFVFANESWFVLCRASFSIGLVWCGNKYPYQKGGKLLACITVVLAIEGWHAT
jgi:hypothetical protein